MLPKAQVGQQPWDVIPNTGIPPSLCTQQESTTPVFTQFLGEISGEYKVHIRSEPCLICVISYEICHGVTPGGS